MASPLELAWKLLKIDPHEEEDWELNAYMRGQEKANEEAMGIREEEEDPDADLVTNPLGVPKPGVTLDEDTQLDSNLAQHATETAEADAMAGAPAAAMGTEWDKYDTWMAAQEKAARGETLTEEDEDSTE